MSAFADLGSPTIEICTGQWSPGGSDAVYEYICQECHASFETILTLRERETEVHCPKCDSKRVVQDATEFYAVTSRKS